MDHSDEFLPQGINTMSGVQFEDSDPTTFLVIDRCGPQCVNNTASWTMSSRMEGMSIYVTSISNLQMIFFHFQLFGILMAVLLAPVALPYLVPTWIGGTQERDALWTRDFAYHYTNVIGPLIDKSDTLHPILLG
jgi:hypothetical protein